MGIMDKLKGLLPGQQQQAPLEDEQEQAKKEEEQKKLDKWKKRLDESLSGHDIFRQACTRYDELYNGSHTIDNIKTQSYMSDRDKKDMSAANARQVVNIVFQLIESQIDISVPTPVVDPIESLDDQDRKKMIEGMLKYMSEGSELRRVASSNERIAKKNGLAVFKVMYDPNKQTHLFRGKIEVTNPHPTNIIPQKGVYRVEDMDYLFHIENRTIDQVCRMYGEEFREQLEYEHAEYDYFDKFTDQVSQGETNGRVSVIEAWYKDRDNDICLLTWCGDVLLRDLPKFFYKRDPETGDILEFEDIDIETPIVTYDEMGQEVIETSVKVKAHVPQRFPFVIWYNIPKEKSYYGKSDAEVIYDQQEGIKKLLSIEEEKQIRGTTKIITRTGSGLKDNLNNALSQVLETDDPSGDVKVVDLKTPDRSLIELYQIYVQAAKDSIGITEASQGRSESTTLSGRALEMLTQNTASRMSTKMYEKQVVFMELYRLLYDFMLAFYDEKIPFRVENNNNQSEFGVFDKAALIKQDISGEYYYPPFDVYVDVDAGLPKDKRFIMDSAAQALQLGAMDSVEYWTIMESIGYPNASAILEMEQAKMQQAQMMQEQQMMMQAQGQQMQQDMNNHQMEMDKQAAQQEQGEPPVDPMQAFQEELNQLSPEEQEAFAKMPPEQQQALIEEYTKLIQGESKK